MKKQRGRNFRQIWKKFGKSPLTITIFLQIEPKARWRDLQSLQTINKSKFFVIPKTLPQFFGSLFFSSPRRDKRKEKQLFGKPSLSSSEKKYLVKAIFSSKNKIEEQKNKTSWQCSPKIAPRHFSKRIAINFPR